LAKGLAYLHKIHKTKDASNFGVVPADPNIYRKSIPHCPTGSLVMDFLIGGAPNEYGVPPCPGFPRGRIIQIWGHESSGKTTLALTAAATCIANGGTVLFVDFEHEMVAGYAKALGVPVEDQNKFLWVQPDTLEQGFQTIKVMILSGVDMIIVDSVGSAAPTADATRDIADINKARQPGLIAKGWNDFWNDNKPLLTKSQTSFVALSQMRSIIGATGFQKKTKPQGGNVWKFIASIRVELARIGTEKSNAYNAITHKKEATVGGAKIKAKIVKSKLSMSAGHEAIFYIRWGQGIDDIRSLIEIGKAHNVIKTSGSWYTFPTGHGDVRAQGVDGMRKAVLEDEQILDTLYAKVLPFLTAATPEGEQFDEALEDDFADEAIAGALEGLDKDKKKALDAMVEESKDAEKAKEAEKAGFEPEDNQ
jgi:recombination protein RecA